MLQNMSVCLLGTACGCRVKRSFESSKALLDKREGKER